MLRGSGQSEAEGGGAPACCKPSIHLVSLQATATIDPFFPLSVGFSPVSCPLLRAQTLTESIGRSAGSRWVRSAANDQLRCQRTVGESLSSSRLDQSRWLVRPLSAGLPVHCRPGRPDRCGTGPDPGHTVVARTGCRSVRGVHTPDSAPPPKLRPAGGSGRPCHTFRQHLPGGASRGRTLVTPRGAGWCRPAARGGRTPPNGIWHLPATRLLQSPNPPYDCPPQLSRYPLHLTWQFESHGPPTRTGGHPSISVRQSDFERHSFGDVFASSTAPTNTFDGYAPQAAVSRAAVAARRNWLGRLLGM